jgi:hypothetical protein
LVRTAGLADPRHPAQTGAWTIDIPEVSRGVEPMAFFLQRPLFAASITFLWTVVAQAEQMPEAGAPAAVVPLPGRLNSGDTAWILTSTALVLMMTISGSALSYGGMVRKMNVLATLTESFAVTCLVTVLWMAVSYSLAFTGGSVRRRVEPFLVARNEHRLGKRSGQNDP